SPWRSPSCARGRPGRRSRARSQVTSQALERLIHVDLAPGQRLEHLHVRRRGGWAIDAQLLQETVEAGAGGRVADPEVSLEVLHVSARCQEDLQHRAVLGRQGAELAGLEAA